MVDPTSNILTARNQNRKLLMVVSTIHRFNNDDHERQITFGRLFKSTNTNNTSHETSLNKHIKLTY